MPTTSYRPSFKNHIWTNKHGDIDIFYNGTYYEYDSFTNRYYMLDNGTTVNSPDGKLAKRRMKKADFLKIQSLAQNAKEVDIRIENKILKEGK